VALSKNEPETGGRAHKQPWDDAAIDAIIERCKALPILDDRSDDEILGYDENGLPS
jgi:hypothetical protein